MLFAECRQLYSVFSVLTLVFQEQSFFVETSKYLSNLLTADYSRMLASDIKASERKLPSWNGI